MPQNNQTNCTEEQERMVRHIEAAYADSGMSPKTVRELAWEVVNKLAGFRNLRCAGQNHEGSHGNK